jgi:hypothetical protein
MEPAIKMQGTRTREGDRADAREREEGPTNEVRTGHTTALRHQHVRSLGVHVVGYNVSRGLYSRWRVCTTEESTTVMQRCETRKEAGVMRRHPPAPPLGAGTPAAGPSWTRGTHTCPAPALNGYTWTVATRGRVLTALGMQGREAGRAVSVGTQHALRDGSER